MDAKVECGRLAREGEPRWRIMREGIVDGWCEIVLCSGCVGVGGLWCGVDGAKNQDIYARGRKNIKATRK